MLTSASSIVPTRKSAMVLGLAIVLLLAATGCSKPSTDSMVQLLSEGLWHASVGSEDIIFELTFTDGAFGGRLHRVIHGKQIAEITVVEVLLDGRAIEISLAPFPSYYGKVDVPGKRIEGGMPDMPAYREMDLSRVEWADWPMVGALPMPRPEEPEYRWTQPEERGDGWPSGTLADAGVDEGAVEAMIAAIIDGDAGALHSILVARNGRMIIEHYFHGWGPEDLHRIASVTKSVSSLLIGIAIDRGQVSGVDAPVLDFFPRRRAGAGSGWDGVRLEHILTMSMGLDWTDEEAEQYAPGGEDRLSAVLLRNVATEPGTRWRYVNRNVHLLSGVLLQATGLQADAFAAENLFAPLGITTWDWEENKFEEHPSMSGTLMLRPRDMAKLGQLVLNEGQWAERQVVSPEWIEESTHPHTGDSSDPERYGYLWRLLDDPKPEGTVLASGIGSQFIVVVPSLDLVVVTTGGNEFNGLHAAILNVAMEHLGPGINRTQ